MSLIFSLLCSAIAALSGRALTDILNSPELDAGFHLLYELKPSEARAQFDVWQKSYPEDPLGAASEAASYLFEECYRQGVLTSEFFLDDKRFLGKIPLKPNDALRAAFFTANEQAQDMARLRLTTNPQDADASLSKPTRGPASLDKLRRLANCRIRKTKFQICWSRKSQPGNPCETHAVLDDVEHLSVRQLLYVLCLEVGYFW